MKIAFELTLDPGADPRAIADLLFDYLCMSEDEETPGVASFDGYQILEEQ